MLRYEYVWEKDMVADIQTLPLQITCSSVLPTKFELKMVQEGSEFKINKHNFKMLPGKSETI